ncbi:MAG: hypothetical protein NZ853_08425 [Leptospiraceae bacterium]|nr:hypothetical protein [Leptospiraceae bacterium]MDW7976799.1 hypothetical protein [Leptospiraceae bacterium]
MSFLWALKLLSASFDFRLYREFEKFPHFEVARKVFYFYHMPFLIHYIFFLISPFFWYQILFKKESFFSLLFTTYLPPLFIYGGTFIFLVLMDKFEFYSQPPTLYRKNPYFGIKNAIMITSNLIFFLVHPILGWLALGVSSIMTFVFSIIQWSLYLEKPISKTFAESLLLVSLFLLVAVLILFIVNLFESIQLLQRFGLL